MKGACQVGQGAFAYEVKDNWAQRPPGISWPEVAAVAVDSRGRVFVFNRGDHPVAVFDGDGTFLHSWGEGYFVGVHGITIGPDDSVYCTDHAGHTVDKFTPEGKFLLRLGTRGRPSPTGAVGTDCRTVRRAAGPFNFPTTVALSPEGEIYVADGYGNTRVHKFAPDGRLLASWGTPGVGPGQFHLLHGIAVNRQGTVFVADRENCRVQSFSPDGTFLRQWCDWALDSGVRQMRQMAKSLLLHKSGILSWWKHRINNGRMEGINYKIKTLLRQTYGLRDERYFVLRLFGLHHSRHELLG